MYFSGCEITTTGKLLLVFDTINTTLQTYFLCFCKFVRSRLNNTNVSSEVLSGDMNIQTCEIQRDPLHVDQNILRNELTNLSSEFSIEDNKAGMAIILSDRGLTSENLTDIPDDKEPFVNIVNVGQIESESGSCFHQHKFVSDVGTIDLAMEIETFGCKGWFFSACVSQSKLYLILKPINVLSYRYYILLNGSLKNISFKCNNTKIPFQTQRT